MFKDYLQYDGMGLAELIKKKQVSASEVMETAIELANEIDEKLNFRSVDCADLGRESAKKPLPDGPLAGVPYLLKDTFTSWKGTVTTNGCNLFKNYVSPSDSETVRRAKAGGLLLFAKSTTPEWGWALATETLCNGDTLNPWDLSRTPGGSSGGGAAAVAAGVVPFANASDGGGSIRVPACYSGLFGLKPSRGRISWGPELMDVGAGMAQEGCVSRTVRDTAAYLDLMHGQLPGERDLPPQLDGTFVGGLAAKPRKLRIGFTTASLSHVPTYAPGIDGVQKAVKLCQDLGHTVEEMSFKGYDYVKSYQHARAIYGVGHLSILTMARDMKGSEPCGIDFMRFMFESARSSASMTALEYSRHIEGVRLGARQVENACAPFDLVLTPMSTIPPPKIGANHMHTTELEEYHSTLRDYGMVFSVPFNVSGQPACSIPIDIDPTGLPVGLQIVGKWGDEAAVLGLAAEFERAVPWIDRHPPIWAGHIRQVMQASFRGTHR